MIKSWPNNDQIMIKSWSKISSTTARSSFGLGQSSNAGPTVQSAVGTYCSGIFYFSGMFQIFIRFHQNQERSLTPDRCNHFEPPNRVQRCRRRRLHRDCKPPTRCWNITVIQLSDIWWMIIDYILPPTSNQVLEHFYAIILCYMIDDHHVLANL